MSLKTIPFLLLSCFSLHAVEPVAEKQKEYIRVTEDDTSAKLQTSIVTLEKDGKKVDLIGAIHIADKAYYTALNERFTQYDRLLFEMVGGEKLGIQEKVEVAKEGKAEQPAEQSKLSGLKDIYAMFSKFLGLAGQAEHVDYKAKNFVHADMTAKEFEEKQKARNETLLGLAMKSETQKKPAAAKEPNVAKLIGAMLAGNSNMMKMELIHTLGQGDDQVSIFAGETVILTDRNAKCLEVLQQQLAQNHGKLGIFYGSAHFPTMEKTLIEQGWKRTNEEWLTAWDIPKAKKAAVEPEKAKESPDDLAKPEIKKAA